MNTLRIEATAVLLASAPVQVAALTRTPEAIPASATIGDAMAAMEDADVSALLVEPWGGLVTERDIVRAFTHGAATDDPVTTIGTRCPLSVPAHTSVLDATNLMLEANVRHLVVETDLGPRVVSLRDLAGVLLHRARPEDVPSETWLG